MRPLDPHLVAARGDIDTEQLLDPREVPVMLAVERGEKSVVVESQMNGSAQADNLSWV